MAKSYLKDIENLEQAFREVSAIEKTKEICRSDLDKHITSVSNYFRQCDNLKESLLRSEIISNEVIADFMKVYVWHFELCKSFLGERVEIEEIPFKYNLPSKPLGLSWPELPLSTSIDDQLNIGGYYHIQIYHHFRDKLSTVRSKLRIYLTEFIWDEKNPLRAYKYRIMSEDSNAEESMMEGYDLFGVIKRFRGIWYAFLKKELNYSMTIPE